MGKKKIRKAANRNSNQQPSAETAKGEPHKPAHTYANWEPILWMAVPALLGIVFAIVGLPWASHPYIYLWLTWFGVSAIIFLVCRGLLHRIENAEDSHNKIRKSAVIAEVVLLAMCVLVTVLIYVLIRNSTRPTSPFNEITKLTPPASPVSSVSPITAPSLQLQSTPLVQLVPPGIKQPVNVEVEPGLYGVLGQVRDGTKKDSLDYISGSVIGTKITLLNLKTKQTFEAGVDNWGHFTTTVPLGRYKVTATHPDYLPASKVYEVARSETYDPLDLEMIQKPDVLANREDSEGIVIGRARTEGGAKLITGVRVTVRSKERPEQIPLEMTTKADGYFTFQVQHGSYIVTLEHPQYDKLTLECNTQKGSRCDFQMTEMRATAK